MSKVEARDTVCEVCQIGKQARLPFRVNKAWRARDRLELVHFDVCGPMKTSSLNDSKYFVLFIDDLTRFCWVYFLKHKSEVFEAFCKFKALTENQSGCKIKSLRSDNGTEYLSERFQKLCEQARIHHQLTTVYTPKQNRVCERKNRIVLDMARCLLFESKLPSKFWAEAVNTSIYLLNKLPTYAVFSCACYALIPAEKRTKLERRVVPRIFVSYSSTKKGYRVFDPSTKKILVSRDVRFDEEKVWSWNGEDADLIEEDYLDSNLEPVENEPNNEDFDNALVRGTRTIANIYQRCDVAIVEPSDFEEAAKDKSWKKGMEAE
ncbi:pleiotropic drug resistance protein 3-like [Gossypium australe]|uniref:Pleiotropic drug resistance protein 3-like n=1 Tax=Gossypium australe TaxID=47621 RepID=A0A5B6WVA5_9ROSI|nr:pleiotropic drug resistance protein 3-like [Gossypium australe]